MVQTRPNPARIHGEFRGSSSNTITWYDVATGATYTFASGQRLVLLSLVLSANGSVRVRLMTGFTAGLVAVDVQLVAGRPLHLAWEPPNLPENVAGSGVQQPSLTFSGLTVSASVEGLVRRVPGP